MIIQLIIIILLFVFFNKKYRKRYSNIAIIFIIIFLICILFSNKLKYYLITSIYSTFAPSSSNSLLKPVSDKLYLVKQSIEEDIRVQFSDPKQSIMSTYEYSDIKDVLDDKTFAIITENYTKPVLIKNVYTKESLLPYRFSNLSEKHGNIEIQAINYGEQVDGTVGSIKVPFSKYLELINRGKKYYMTVNNSLANAMDKKKFMKFYMKILKGTNGFSNLFVGNKGSSTHLHCEIAASCATQITGSKKWYIVDSKYCEYLNSIPDKNQIFHMSIRGFKKGKDEIMENIPRYEVITDPGDFLFVPPWWWHETLNLSKETLMLSYRPSLFTAPYKTNFTYTMLGLRNSLGFNSLMYPFLIDIGVIEPGKDVVVESITQIGHRTPAWIKQKLED